MSAGCYDISLHTAARVAAAPYSLSAIQVSLSEREGCGVQQLNLAAKREISIWSFNQMPPVEPLDRIVVVIGRWLGSWGR
jgi:hypothetical protein